MGGSTASQPGMATPLRELTGVMVTARVADSGRAVGSAAPYGQQTFLSAPQAIFLRAGGSKNAVFL